jgi:hypothetical protein
MASFNLGSLKLNHAANDSVKLVIHTREYSSTINKTYELTYKFSAQSALMHDAKIPFPLKLDSKIH